MSRKMWHWRTTRNSNMAAKTGNADICGTMTDGVEIPTANLGFTTTASSRKVSHATATTTDNQKWQYSRFGHQSCHFLLPVVIARSHLVTPLPSSPWSKVPNLPLEFRWYLSYVRDISTSGCRSSSKSPSLRSPWYVSSLEVRSWTETNLTLF